MNTKKYSIIIIGFTIFCSHMQGMQQKNTSQKDQPSSLAQRRNQNIKPVSLSKQSTISTLKEHPALVSVMQLAHNYKEMVNRVGKLSPIADDEEKNY